MLQQRGGAGAFVFFSVQNAGCFRHYVAPPPTTTHHKSIPLGDHLYHPPLRRGGGNSFFRCDRHTQTKMLQLRGFVGASDKVSALCGVDEQAI